MSNQAQEILEKLDHIELDLAFIKKHMRDIDVVLTDDDISSLCEAEQDLKEGKTKRLV